MFRIWVVFCFVCLGVVLVRFWCGSTAVFGLTLYVSTNIMIQFWCGFGPTGAVLVRFWCGSDVGSSSARYGFVPVLLWPWGCGVVPAWASGCGVRIIDPGVVVLGFLNGVAVLGRFWFGSDSVGAVSDRFYSLVVNWVTRSPLC